MKKLVAIVCAVSMILAFSVCFATSSGEAEFVSALTSGINADTMWGAVTPVAPIIIFTFIFAFAFTIIRRVLKKGSRGKFGM